MSRKLAVITGASSGIGEAYARELAKREYDLILVARRLNRLESIAKELRSKYGVDIESKRVDLAQILEIEKLAGELQNKKIDLLVNNAGFGIGRDFQLLEDRGIQDMIQVHVLAPTILSRAVVSEMIEKKSGSIINVASMAALIRVPGSSIYPGTKSYLLGFSKSLQRTLRKSGVKIQALCPGYTYSEFHNASTYQGVKKKGPGFLWMSAEAVVKISLAKLSARKVLCIPGFINHFLLFLMKFPPTAWFLWQSFERKRK